MKPPKLLPCPVCGAAAKRDLTINCAAWIGCYPNKPNSHAMAVWGKNATQRWNALPRRKAKP